MSQVKTYISELEEISKSVENSFSGLEDDILFKKPDSSTWSIAENLEHLIILNSSYFPIFEKVKNGTFQGAFISKIGFFPKMIGDMIYKSVSDGGKKKVKTFPLWEPKLYSDQDEAILEKFYDHQKILIQKIREMEPFLGKGIIIHSPANKIVVYSLDKALEIIVAHERRHLEQAQRLVR
ncbi:DinB family protein [Belliella marina]|uniref:DinB family protein n=1 Tax=Belliella marina TaxID=1644146 RepID=A0ABW4VSJ5_9BACT